MLGRDSDQSKPGFLASRMKRISGLTIMMKRSWGCIKDNFNMGISMRLRRRTGKHGKAMPKYGLLAGESQFSSY